MNAFGIAWDSIWHHKTRSFLTALGIVIGVFAVVTLTSLGGAVKTYVNQKFSGVGANLMTVVAALPSSGTQHGFGHGRGGGGANAFVSVPSTLTVGDLNALLHPRPSAIATATATITVPDLISYHGRVASSAGIQGVTSTYFGMQNSKFQTGRFQSDGVVLGPSLAKTFFGKTDAVGKAVTIGGSTYPVTGVLTSSSGAPGSDPNNTAYLPLTTALKLAHQTTVSEIIIAAKTAQAVPKAEKQANAVLLKRHPSHNYKIETSQEILSTVTSTTSVITDFLAGIAGISLLVGGIGIMNIMLVTVSERFREIGIRKALGAHDSDILVQFLSESVLLAFIGGFLGTLLAALATHVVGKAVGIPANLTTSSVVTAVVFSLLVGAVFGVLPAMRAARLMPAEALRTD
jgi:putative ABC transport system permease protein